MVPWNRNDPGKKDLPPTPQRTEPRLWADPAPRMEEEAIWVVLTGNPNREERWIMMEEQVLALNPCSGLILYNFDPRVFMIRQPPGLAPESQSQGTSQDDPFGDIKGVLGEGLVDFPHYLRRNPVKKRRSPRLIIPIPFWVSLNDNLGPRKSK